MAWGELFDALIASEVHEQTKAPEQTLPCRVYHNNGQIVSLVADPRGAKVTFDQLPYIEVDSNLFQKINPDQYRVVKNTLVPIDKPGRPVVKLVKDSFGPYRTVAGYMSLLLLPGEEVEKVEFYNDKIS